MMRLSLLVLYCKNFIACHDFYRALGFELRLEKHGSGPFHYSAQLGKVVFELYPAEEKVSSSTRLEFFVDDLVDVCSRLMQLHCLYVHTSKDKKVSCKDPDGRTIEFRFKPV